MLQIYCDGPYLPAMNELFGSAPIGWDAWALIVAFGLMVYVIVEVEKQLRGHVLQGEPMQLLAPSDRVVIAAPSGAHPESLGSGTRTT
ncbi:MAG: hypothetical protein FJ271_33975 [Planctomycetes bacterium]|nr:hypothetical protein [Planctomycetota bacterium]